MCERGYVDRTYGISQRYQQGHRSQYGCHFIPTNNVACVSNPSRNTLGKMILFLYLDPFVNEGHSRGVCFFEFLLEKVQTPSAIIYIKGILLAEIITRLMPKILTHTSANLEVELN